MSKVYSVLTGGYVDREEPKPVERPANYEQVIEDLGAMVKDLRARLAESETARQAAEARAMELDSTKAKCADLEQKLAVATAACKTAAPGGKESKPVAYEVVVKERDGEGRLSRMELLPAGTRKTAI